MEQTRANESELKRQPAKDCRLLFRFGYLVLLYQIWGKNQPTLRSNDVSEVATAPAVLVPVSLGSVVVPAVSARYVFISFTPVGAELSVSLEFLVPSFVIPV